MFMYFKKINWAITVFVAFVTIFRGVCLGDEPSVIYDVSMSERPDLMEFNDFLRVLVLSVPDDVDFTSDNSLEKIYEFSKAMEKCSEVYFSDHEYQGEGTSRLYLKLVGSYQEFIDENLIEGYSPKSVLVNVPSPIGSGIPAGGNPDAIGDNVLREKYLADLAQNARKSRENSLQNFLNYEDRKLTRVLSRLKASGVVDVSSNKMGDDD